MNNDPFKNDSIKGEYTDKGVVLSFENIIDLSREENANLYPVFNENKFKMIGNYYIYIDDNLNNIVRIGAVYIDKTTILPMFIDHIPTSGITPELEAMFKSFKVQR